MDHRVVRGVSWRFAVTAEQWQSEWFEDTGALASSNPRDHLRLVKPMSEPALDVVHVLARLKAENLALRNRVVDLALSIQALQQRAPQRHTAD